MDRMIEDVKNEPEEDEEEDDDVNGELIHLKRDDDQGEDAFYQGFHDPGQHPDLNPEDFGIHQAIARFPSHNQQMNVVYPRQQQQQQQHPRYHNLL